MSTTSLLVYTQPTSTLPIKFAAASPLEKSTLSRIFITTQYNQHLLKELQILIASLLPRASRTTRNTGVKQKATPAVTSMPLQAPQAVDVGVAVVVVVAAGGGEGPEAVRALQTTQQQQQKHRLQNKSRLLPSSENTIGRLSSLAPPTVNSPLHMCTLQVKWQGSLPRISARITARRPWASLIQQDTSTSFRQRQWVIAPTLTSSATTSILTLPARKRAPSQSATRTACSSARTAARTCAA